MAELSTKQRLKKTVRAGFIYNLLKKTESNPWLEENEMLFELEMHTTLKEVLERHRGYFYDDNILPKNDIDQLIEDAKQEILLEFFT